jgi:CheY-like chemotaxis protein
MDGFSVAGALRRDPATSQARLIAVTGYGRPEDRTRALEAGFDEHLVKPVDPVALLARLAAAASKA